MKLTDIEIQKKIKPIEDKIKFGRAINREDIQNALDMIKGQGLSPDSKKAILKSMVGRTGVKKIGMVTNLVPRNDIMGEVDKTYDFLNDIYSYKGVIEKEK